MEEEEQEQKSRRRDMSRNTKRRRRRSRIQDGTADGEERGGEGNSRTGRVGW